MTLDFANDELQSHVRYSYCIGESVQTLQPGTEEDGGGGGGDFESREDNTVKGNEVENVAQEAKADSFPGATREIEQTTVAKVGSSDSYAKPTAATDRGSATEDRESYPESRVGDNEQEIWRQIEALNSACHVRFSCTVAPCTSDSAESVLSPKKKPKLSSERVSGPEVEGKECVLLEFELISGENRDLLHQIVQYLKNTTFRH